MAIRLKGIAYGSDPFEHTNGRTSTRRGGRGFYFEDPYGRLLEVIPWSLTMAMRVAPRA